MKLHRIAESLCIGIAEGGDSIRAGFIGAGKAGCSLARYFEARGILVSGFLSRTRVNINFKFFDSFDELIEKSDIIFLTVTDSAIAGVWNGLKELDLRDKIICHCSGSLSSDIFIGADRRFVCSVHPMLAFESRHVSVNKISKAFFTLEGGEKALTYVKALLDVCHNQYVVIDKNNKPKYHAAACFASNFVTAVCAEAFSLMEECGFDEKTARKALVPLMQGNMENICEKGTKASLTGPIARNDIITVKKHLDCLGKETRFLYQAAGRALARLAGNDDACLYKLLGENEDENY